MQMPINGYVNLPHDKRQTADAASRKQVTGPRFICPSKQKEGIPQPKKARPHKAVATLAAELIQRNPETLSHKTHQAS